MPVIDILADSDFAVGVDTHFGYDEFLFTRDTTDLKHNRKLDTADGSTMGSRVKNKKPTMQDGTITAKGNARMATGQSTAIINQRIKKGQKGYAWYAIEGLDETDPITFQPSWVTDATIDSKKDDPVTADVELGAAGAIDDGHILLSPLALLSGATGNGLMVDNLVATTAGGKAQMHLWCMDGGTVPTITIDLKSSPDGTTWTTFKSFTVMSGVGAQRIQISLGTTINAKVRAYYTIANTPTAVQGICMFGRN